MDRELTPKQQTSEAIRQAETILIMTGQHPSVDQVASTIALAALLRKFGKKVTSVVSDEVPAGAKFLQANLLERQLGGLRDFIVSLDLSHAELDKLKYTIENGKLNVHITPFAGGFQQRDVSFGYGEYQFDLIIVLGVATYARIDKVYAQNAELLRQIPLINIDFHRSNEQYGAINLIEGTAASLGEILIALSESLQSGMIDEQIATTMLTGLMAATDRFTATHTTAKTMTVAAQMMAMGADQQSVVRGLYRENRERSDSRDRQPVGQSAPAAPQSRPPAPVPVQEPQARPLQHVTEAIPIEEGSRPTASAQPPTAPSAPAAPTAPTVAPTQPTLPVEPLEPVMEELLPPHHIEMSDLPEPANPDSELLPEAAPSVRVEPPTVEPLINSTEPPRQRPATPPASNRGANPTNNPVFAQRLDEFSY